MKNNIPGWMSEAELEVLNRIGLTLPVGSTVLEIGSFLGRSAFTWSLSLFDQIGSVICVDPWEGTIADFPEGAVAAMDGDTEFLDHTLSLYKHFLINTRELDNVFAIRLPGQEFHWIMTPTIAPPAVIFIDGDHSPNGLLFDLEASLPNQQYGAHDMTLICGHDYGHPDIPHIKPIVDGFAIRNGFRVQHFEDTRLFALRWGNRYENFIEHLSQ
jgi:hypothetical protein